MFIAEKPIENESDDILNRKSFAHHLGESLVGWKEKESLVMGLYGERGVGKSSIINLTKKYIDSLNIEDKPTIIEFNPWSFSEQNNLTNHFFNEISKELKLKGDGKNDIKIAYKMRVYADILSFVPNTNNVLSVYYVFLVLTGGISITATQIDNTFALKYIIFAVGISSLVVVILKNFLLNIANFIDSKSKFNSKTLTEVKDEIKEYLEKRNKKLVVIIDDIDRLNEREIKEIFRLVRVNADFPNTIYILPFDRKIIEANLNEQNGVSGKEYLNKIIQVNFDIPFANNKQIHSYLFEELDRILKMLPKSSESLWNDGHWSNLYNSGFKNLFKNIRDIKRFSNSLKFNMSQMYKGEIMEVNPIDFIGIEAIRVFSPDIYNFVKGQKSMFTHTDSSFAGYGNDSREKIKKIFDEAFSKFDVDNLNDCKEVLFVLFPNIKGICDKYGNTHYGSDWQQKWTREQKICSQNYFDSYFTFIPGGNDGGTSKGEIDEYLSSMDSLESFETFLNDNLEKDTINKFLKIIQNYTSDIETITEDRAKNIIQGLLNISDLVSDEGDPQLGIFSNMDSPQVNIGRILYQLLKRERSKKNTFNLVYETILNSKGVYGILKLISTIISDDSPSDLYIEKEKHLDIINLMIKKIKDFSKTEQLLKSKYCLMALYKWRKYTDSEKDLVDYLNSMLDSDEILLKFLNRFINIGKSESSDGVKTIKSFNHNALNEFYSKEQVENIKTRLLQIKNENGKTYQKNKEVIDLYFKEDNDEDI